MQLAPIGLLYTGAHFMISLQKSINATTTIEIFCEYLEIWEIIENSKMFFLIISRHPSLFVLLGTKIGTSICVYEPKFDLLMNFQKLLQNILKLFDIGYIKIWNFSYHNLKKNAISIRIGWVNYSDIL